MENSSVNLPQKQCPLTLDEAMEHEMKHGRLFNDPNMDLKTIRRIISNRLSAQRSRIKMRMYISDLEKMAKDLEGRVCTLTPQLEIYKEKKKLLLLENNSLLPELEHRSNKYRDLEMAIEEKRAKIKLLKEVKKTAQKKQQFSSDSKSKEVKSVVDAADGDN